MSAEQHKRRELRIDARIDPERAAALHATPDRPGPPPEVGDPLPPLWHWAQFWIIARPDALGRDGHPAHGDFMPETGLPRRMWAGGQLEFHAPLAIGDTAHRISTAGDVVRKSGRTGSLAFVTVQHDVVQNGQLCVREKQDLVFREDPDPSAPTAVPQPAPDGAEWQREHQANTTQLFRYSALTFNGHRIHYDQTYAQNVEGYSGLVVHGPLLAQRLFELAHDSVGTIKSFSFRALAPIVHTQTFTACGQKTDKGAELWIRRDDGALAMRATAVRTISKRSP